MILEFPYAYFIWIVIAEYKLPHYFNSLLDWHASSVRGLECGGMNNNGQPETFFFSALKIKSMEFFQCLKMPGGVGKDQ